MNETFSFEMNGKKDWNYDLKKIKDKNNNKVLLRVNNINEKKINLALQASKLVKNKFIKNIKVNSSASQDTAEIEFTLTNDSVQTFDYLTDFPSKLIVDFYYNETLQVEDSVEDGPPQKNKKTKRISSVEDKLDKEIKKSVSRIAKSQEIEQNEQDDQYIDFKSKPQKIEVSQNEKIKTDEKNRKPANTDFFYIEGDLGAAKINLNEGFFQKSNDQFDRFVLQPHEMKNKNDQVLVDYFVNYPILIQPYSFWTKMISHFPEYNIDYVDNDETKSAKLIQKLFNKKRFTVIQQTADWFAKKYPKSKYLDIIFGMVADLHMQEWLKTKKEINFEVAQAYYSKILEHTPNSALAERTSLLTGLLDLENKKYLPALRKLNSHIENSKYSKEISAQYAKMAAALSLAKLGKNEEAIKLISAVSESEIPDQLKAEALYQAADLYFSAGQFQKAADLYVETEKKYPQYDGLFPNAIFNKMEALFHLKNGLLAHETALNFIKKFPSHDFAPYALTRVGELLESLGLPQQKAIGAYLEATFKYGDNPKTIIARLHLMGIRMKGMKELEVEKTIEKMNELAKRSDLENVEQFKTIMISDGYSRRKEYDKALDLLIAQMQNKAQSKNSDQVSKRIRNNINSYIEYLSENKKSADVLKIYKKYADTWLKKQEKPETFYYIGKAYQDLGDYDTALKNFDKSSQFVADNSFKQVISLQQAATHLENNQVNEAEKSINQITNTSLLSPSEQIQRVQLAAKIFEKKEDYSSAIRYLSELVRVWSKDPELVVSSVIQNAFLMNKVGQTNNAITTLDNLLEQKLTDQSRIKVLKAEGEIALQQKNNEVAIKALSSLLKITGSTQSQSRYQLGNLYFEQGNIKKAQEVWNEFSDKDDPFWNKLAQEKMKSDQWQQDYKKYVNRLPAATGVK